MPEFCFQLDDHQIETISKRKALFFDIGVWIKLADGKCHSSRKLRDRLLRLCSKEKVFVPLSPPNLWELRKQKGESLTRCAALMEELSLYVTFRSMDQLFENEITNFIIYLATPERGYTPLSINKIYGPLHSYLSDRMRITPSPDIPTSAQNKQFEHLRNTIENMGVSEYVRLVGGESCPEPNVDGKFQAINIRRREDAGASRNKARRIEQEHIARSILIPKANKIRSKLPIKIQLDIVERFKGLPKSRKYKSAIEHILKFCPALLAYAEVMTVSGLDISRKDNPNDFYDQELLVYGLSYPVLFASLDKWVKSLSELVLEGGILGSLAFTGSINCLSKRLEVLENEI